MKLHEPIVLTENLPQIAIPLTVNLNGTCRKSRSGKYLALNDLQCVQT